MSTENLQILFRPEEGKIRAIHKEIAENKKLGDLVGDDLLFVWYYACKSSPINPDIPDAMRATAAAFEAIKDPEKKKRYASLNFPEKIKAAIEEMKKFNPDVRMVAKRIIQNMFHTLEKMSQTQAEDFEYQDVNSKGEEVTKIDWSGRKQFIDSVAKTADTLPILIKQMEEGFGLSDAKGKEIGAEKSIDKYHSNKET